jgi:hypothetical protein
MLVATAVHVGLWFLSLFVWLFCVFVVVAVDLEQRAVDNIYYIIV